MRGAISKKRGSQPRWPEKAEGMEKSKRARKRKLDTAKTDLKPPLAVLRRAGCPPRVGRKRWKFLHTHEVGQSSHSNGHAILRAHYNSRRDKSCRCCQHNSNCDHERRQVSANFAHRYRNVRTAFITRKHFQVECQVASRLKPVATVFFKAPVDNAPQRERQIVNTGRQLRGFLFKDSAHSVGSCC